jgi:hypothetical protein
VKGAQDSRFELIKTDRADTKKRLEILKMQTCADEKKRVRKSKRRRMKLRTAIRKNEIKKEGQQISFATNRDFAKMVFRFFGAAVVAVLVFYAEKKRAFKIKKSVSRLSFAQSFFVSAIYL